MYIGSTKNFIHRWNRHAEALWKNKHHSSKLQNHFNKYGEEDLFFVVIDICSPEELIKKEQYYLDVLTPYFNICTIAGSTLGVKPSEASKQKNREKHLGIKQSQETINKRRQNTHNNPTSSGHHWSLSDIVKEKHRKAILGIKRSPEAIQNMFKAAALRALAPRHKRGAYGASKYFGVSYNGKYISAQIYQYNKKIHIGNFKTEEEAARAYDKKAKELFGSNATVNFKEEL